MNRSVIYFILAIFFLIGCKTVPEKERLLSNGTFEQKVAYIEDHDSDKAEVTELLGRPDTQKDFSGTCSMWSYGKTKEKLDITFGGDNKLLYVERKSKE